MNRIRSTGPNHSFVQAILAMALIAALSTGAWAVGRSRRQKTAAAQQPLALSPQAQRAIAQIYQGDPGSALSAAEGMEKQNPNQPLGYLIEAEARWWQLYCSHSEIRYGMVDLWQLPKGPAETAYINAAKHAAELGEQEIQQSETGQEELWAGMGYALESRMYAAQGQKMATARAGVKARTHLLRALALDPKLADANTGLGLYNYYVDTLSPIVKLLRIFLGIPGGSKQKGIEQLHTAMQNGQITDVEARFYLARNLRTYDQNYEQALAMARPLERNYPQNPIFLLLIGNLEMELGRKTQAKATLGRIDQLKIPDAACAKRSRRLAQELLQEK